MSSSVTRKSLVIFLKKLAEEMGSGYEIMHLNSSGGSTIQWGTERDLLCLELTL